MMRTIEQLVNETNRRLGNHRVTSEEVSGKSFRYYWYFDTIICTVNETEGYFCTDNGGWETTSTQRAINDYRNYYQNLDFAERFDDLDKMCNYLVCLPNRRKVHVMYGKIEEPHYIMFYKEHYKNLDFSNSKMDGEKHATISFNTPDNGEVEHFTYKGPKSLEEKLREMFRFYIDKNA